MERPPLSEYEPSLVQKLAMQPLGRPSIPEAPDMSGFSKPMASPITSPSIAQNNVTNETLPATQEARPPLSHYSNEEAVPAGSVTSSVVEPVQSSFPLRPFNPGEKRDNADGSYSTEVTATVQSPDGKWMVVPSLWMDTQNNKPVDLLPQGDDTIAETASQYEQSTGKQFPRFDDLDSAEAWAVSRSEGGGVGQGLLANEARPPLTKYSPFHTKDDIINNPEEFNTVKEYMVNRMGEQWKNRSPEETVDAFVTHMRYFGSNELSTLGELRHNMGATPEVKDITKKAYSVYDDLSSFLNNDGIGGALGGAKDYLAATLTAPSTYLGALVGGKVVSKVFSTAAKEAMVKTAAVQALKTGGPQAAKDVIKAAVRQKAMAGAIVGAGTEVGANVFQDLAYQTAKMDVGAQEGIDPVELGITAAFGAIGGGVSGYTPQALRGLSGLDKAGQRIVGSQRKRATSAASTAGPKVAKSIKANVKKLSQDLTKWKKDVEAGKAINPDMVDMSNVTSWFFNKDDPDSLFRIINDSGADIDLSDEAHFTSQLVDFARKLPADSLDEINTDLKPLGLNFGQMLDVVSAVQNQAGVNMNKAQQAKMFAKAVAGASAEAKKVDTAILKDVKSVTSTPKQFDDLRTVGYITSLWRRMLISNPATSAINVQGWGMAFLAKTMAEVLHGGVLGTAGLAGKMVGKKWGGTSLGRSKALFENQVFKARAALDPYSSFEGFKVAMENAPKKYRDEVEHTLFGGIEAKSVPEQFGFSPDNPVLKVTEGIADFAARATLVKTQDVLTKTYSGITELDKLSRLEYGKGIDDLINDGEFHLVTNDMWQATINQMSKDTMSADYTKGNHALNKIAKHVEGISNTPGLGFLFPFGRFMNNNIAFAIEYSPIGLWPIATNLFKRSSYDTMEKLSRVAVGSMALATLINYTEEQQKRGNQWWEVEEKSGVITNRQNLAPASLFMVFARIKSLYNKGEGIPREMWKELAEQLGVGQWSKEVTGQNALSDLVGRISSAQPLEVEDFNKFLGWMMKYTAGIGAGFTRPLDPINKYVGMGTGSDVAIDRRQATGGLEAITQELTRYTNAFFAPFFGEPVAEDGSMVLGTPARSATGPKGDLRDPNPTSSLFARKEQPPKDPISQLLGMTNLPPYTFNSRTASPEFDLFMNERILPLLNYKARNLMKSPMFNQLPQFEKVAQTKEILSESEQEIILGIEKGDIGADDERLFDARRKWAYLSEADRTAAKLEFGITAPDRELTQMQIDVMKNYIEEHGKLMKYMRE